VVDRRARGAGSTPGRRQRSDAERNRSSLLTSAQTLYAEQGIDVSLEQIARQAGVGIGTLYRHFPRGKEQLVAEALVGQVGRYVDLAHRGRAASDPWQGFVVFVEEICKLQECDLGLGDILAMTLPAGAPVERLRRQANDLAIEIIDRAKAAGKLRQDFVAEDLLLLLVSNAAVVQVTRTDAPAASRRLVTLFLAAVRSRRSADPLARPPSSAQMRRAMARLASDHGCAGAAERLSQTQPAVHRPG
jgi:AcrR family transcriptional regulator